MGRIQLWDHILDFGNISKINNSGLPNIIGMKWLMKLQSEKNDVTTINLDTRNMKYFKSILLNLQ